MDKGKTIGDSQTGWNVMSDAGSKSAVTTESFYLIVENPSGKLDTPANRAAVADMTKRLTGLTATIAGTQVPAFYTDPKSQLPPVVDPFVLAAAAPDQAQSVLSADGTTAIVTATSPVTTARPRPRRTPSSRWPTSSRSTTRISPSTPSTTASSMPTSATTSRIRSIHC